MGLSQSDAEDVAQDVLIKLWHSRASYRADAAQVSTWLYTIARNTAVNHLKRVSCRQVPLQEFELEDDSQHRPDQVLLLQDQRQRLSMAIQQLPIDDRCAIALFYIDELSIAQAASILKCNPNAFKTRLSRARNKLSIIVKQMEDTQ
jgi:RNA polymerase sigma-70 factor (ECF subfamily)